MTERHRILRVSLIVSYRQSGTIGWTRPANPDRLKAKSWKTVYLTFACRFQDSACV